MNSIIYDTHNEYKGFIEAGFNQRQAEQITQALKHSFEKNLANKEDIAKIELKINETNREITLIRKDIETIRKEFDFKIADVKKDIETIRKEFDFKIADVKKDIEQLRADTKKEFAHTNERIEQLRADTTLKIESEGRKNTNKLLIILMPSLFAITGIIIGAMFAMMNALSGL